MSLEVRRQAIDRGLLLRPLGNVLYLMPPYCVTDEEIALIYEGIENILVALRV